MTPTTMPPLTLGSLSAPLLAAPIVELRPNAYAVPCAGCIARQRDGLPENPLHPCCTAHLRSARHNGEAIG